MTMRPIEVRAIDVRPIDVWPIEMRPTKELVEAMEMSTMAGDPAGCYRTRGSD